MGINFDVIPSEEKDEKEEIMETFDLVHERAEIAERMENSEEISAILSQISVHDPNTIVSFGAESANEVSKASDQVLSTMDMRVINDSGAMLETLGRIMDRFDPKDLVPERKGVLGRFFTNVQRQIEQMLTKYNTMGEEVDKVYVQLRKYEAEIYDSNKKLDNLFHANVDYYNELVKYILAGEQGVKQIEDVIVERKAQLADSQDGNLQMEINNMEQAKIMLESRVMDLRMAENVAMQSVPMLKSMKYSNLNLVRKINSAFIVTLPVFKQGLTQAIMLKRQQVQADAMKALDDRTNEMLLRNAQNVADQTKLTAQLASNSSIKIETLEKTWQTIVQGIEETRQIQIEASKKRKEDTLRLEQLKGDFQKQANTRHS